MKLYQYKNYEEYVLEQEKANVAKLERVWVRKENLEWLVSKCEDVQKIICHGTRNAAEQKFFKDLIPNCDVIGTEISSTASKFPMTVQWDFAEPKDEWIENFDLLYSNSFDHSFDIDKTMETWYNQVKIGGYFCIETPTTKGNNMSVPSDPLSISTAELEKLFNVWDLELIDHFDTWGGWNENWSCRLYLCKKL